MLFIDYVENLYKSPIKNDVLYKSLTTLALNKIAKEIADYIKSCENGTNLTVREIKISVIQSSPKDNSCKYGQVDYSKLRYYIEIYNSENKNCFRLCLFPSGSQSIIAGFYSNYNRTNNSNTFCDKTVSRNEFYTTMNRINSFEFIAEIGNFLMNRKEKPFSDPDKSFSTLN